jgi:cytoskeletal protein CcmA (bactofilin family)
MSDIHDQVATEDNQTMRTVIEQGSRFRGTLESDCQVLVRGSLDGDLSAPSLVVSDTGTVVGNVKAQSIQCAGVLAGRVEADDIYLSGSVRSDTVIRAKTLEVKLQSTRKKLEITFGECTLEVGDDPSIGVEGSASSVATPASGVH